MAQAPSFSFLSALKLSYVADLHIFNYFKCFLAWFYSIVWTVHFVAMKFSFKYLISINLL